MNGAEACAALEVRVRLVLRVAVAVVDDACRSPRPWCWRTTRGVAPAVGAPFVDVVAGVEDEVELLGGDAPVRGEVAGLVVAAAADREAQAIDRGPGRRRGLGAADRADLAAGVEAIEYSRPGCEPAAPRRARCAPAPAARSSVPLRAMSRNARSPATSQRDLDVGHRHAAAVERLRREARPQHDAVGQRIAGGHAERERIDRGRVAAQGASVETAAARRPPPKLPGDVQQLAPREPRSARS